MHRFVVSRDDTLYEAFPDVLLLPDGRLLCTYREGDAHAPLEFTRLVVRESRDRGATWSAPQVLAEAVRGSTPRERWWYWNCPRLARLRDGRLLLSCDTLYRTADGREQSAEAHIWLWESTDGGRTWQEGRDSGVRGIVPDRVVETPQGALLLGAHYRDEAGVYNQVVWRSEDGGQTWQGPVRIAADTALRHCEGSIVVLGDGTLVCYMRENSGLGLSGCKALSRDGGRSWAGPYPTQLVGCHRPTAGLLADGRVLITFGLRFGNGNRDVYAYVESQESAREPDRLHQRGTLLCLDHDNHPQPDSGYTGWAQFPDGEVLCVYYIKADAPRCYIKGCAFRLDELVW